MDDGSIARAGEACSGMERCKVWGLQERETPGGAETCCFGVPLASFGGASTLSVTLRGSKGTARCLASCLARSEGKEAAKDAEAEEPGHG